MDLRDWVIGNVCYFKGTHIWLGSGGLLSVNGGDYSYDRLVSGGYRESLYSLGGGYWEGAEYYFLWDELGCYTVRVGSDVNLRISTHLFGDRVWGSYLWREILEGEYPGFFSCVGCKCFNDKVVTGWCSGKIKGVSVKEGFIWS